MSYQPQNPIRIITAASLFDGHDASINIIRRMLQDAGAEVIHLGHNRSVQDIVIAALQEGAQGICVSSYQGGHMEFFKYMKDLLIDFGAPYIKIFGGGGGVIVHQEKQELEAYGIDRIFHPDDGRRLGLEGMIHEIIKACDFSWKVMLNQKDPGAPNKDMKWRAVGQTAEMVKWRGLDRSLGVAVTAIEAGRPKSEWPFSGERKQKPIVLGITGTGGAGKSSLIDELLQRFRNEFPKKRIAVLCVDPSKRKTGGALLGDRIRMNSLSRDQIFMRSLASRGSGREISQSLPTLVNYFCDLDFDFVICETSGIGQGNVAITEVSDLSLYVMTSEFGAPSQLEKIDMIDYADLIAINKSDRRGSQDALRDVRKQYRRSKKLFQEPPVDADLPVFLTQASHFNDQGVNQLFNKLIELIAVKDSRDWKLPAEWKRRISQDSPENKLLPPERQNYLSEIVNAVRSYKKETESKARCLTNLWALEVAQTLVQGAEHSIKEAKSKEIGQITPADHELIQGWDSLEKQYHSHEFRYEVRGKSISQPLVRQSLSGLNIRRVAFPKLKDWGERYKFLRLENVPGKFPFTAGVFELKRDEEDPKRQFAGEGTPERTNRRFHYLSKNDRAKRLSTAFDSVTLYGEDPNLRPDIYGKVGESGVSVCCLDDMKILYRGFELCDPLTSVSMTINGPAPIILAYYLNTAIDQQIEKREQAQARKLSPEEVNQVRCETLSQVRGTVQADILKEDQAQNTCIFSLDFALKMMADIQQYFIENKIRNFYSVSISGYHIAEAGANPISQLAFTLSNGFTYLEYYRSRGMKVDDFAPNLSFFFSNGLDPEYSVLGRVARRIWSIALRDLYGANERSQKLKYHIQTSGRSLHAQEIDFNDIRTTLQALLAIYDNCNSLHTNAYDEAITTPTEESVRRAMAIQMIINREFGIAKNENPMQGSYFLEELTDLVEEAVLSEFMKINERGGVLGSMETQYQRGKIQDESLYYEHLKHTGELPIVGVNMYIDPKTLEPGFVPPRIEMARATSEEKKCQLEQVAGFKVKNQNFSRTKLAELKKVAVEGGNIFACLMDVARYCTLGEISEALYEVGGQYRRSI